MLNRFIKHKSSINIGHPLVWHHHYQSKNGAKNRLLLLHGSRLGGIETWDPIIGGLTGWSEILVPELRGVGPINPPCELLNSFTINTILDDLQALLDEYHWDDFCMIGYSFGGYISMLLKQKLKNRILHHLIYESAFLAESDENKPLLISALKEIVHTMGVDVNKANDLFTKLVEPRQRLFPLVFKNSPIARRPIYDPIGFSTLMQILIKGYETVDRWQLIADQGRPTSVLTEFAPEGAKIMAHCIKQRYPEWEYRYVEQADHGMLFKKPLESITLINDVFTSYI